jgi:hypothetical protein
MPMGLGLSYRPEGRAFFFEKKKQKTFVIACGASYDRGLKPRER